MPEGCSQAVLFLVVCIYIKKKKRLLGLNSRKGSVLVVTQYSVHGYLLLRVFQYVP